MSERRQPKKGDWVRILYDSGYNRIAQVEDPRFFLSGDGLVRSAGETVGVFRFLEKEELAECLEQEKLDELTNEVDTLWNSSCNTLDQLERIKAILSEGNGEQQTN